jgi:hypothetical protein
MPCADPWPVSELLPVFPTLVAVKKKDLKKIKLWLISRFLVCGPQFVELARSEKGVRDGSVGYGLADGGDML